MADRDSRMFRPNSRVRLQLKAEREDVTVRQARTRRRSALDDTVEEEEAGLRRSKRRRTMPARFREDSGESESSQGSAEGSDGDRDEGVGGERDEEGGRERESRQDSPRGVKATTTTSDAPRTRRSTRLSRLSSKAASLGNDRPPTRNTATTVRTASSPSGTPESADTVELSTPPPSTGEAFPALERAAAHGQTLMAARSNAKSALDQHERSTQPTTNEHDKLKAEIAQMEKVLAGVQRKLDAMREEKWEIENQVCEDAKAAAALRQDVLDRERALDKFDCAMAPIKARVEEEMARRATAKVEMGKIVEQLERHVTDMRAPGQVAL